MHTLTFLTSLLGTTLAWPHLAKPDGHAYSGTGHSGYISVSTTPYGTSRQSTNITSFASGTGGHTIPTSTADSSTVSSTQTSPSFTTPEVISTTWEVTKTLTSFVPASTSITEIGSKTYYSSWISVMYPTTVITSTEYITSTIGPVLQTSTAVIAPAAPSYVTVECLCPAPVTETVYIATVEVPATTITSPILYTYTSTLPNGYTVTTVVPEISTTTAVVPESSISRSIQTITTTILSQSASQSSNATAIQPPTTGTGGRVMPTGTGLWTISSAPVVTQISDGQVQASSFH